MVGAASRIGAGCWSTLKPRFRNKRRVDANLEGVPMRKKDSEHKFWHYKRSDHIHAQCPSKLSAMGKRQDHNIPMFLQNSHAPHGGFKNAGASAREPEAESQVEMETHRRVRVQAVSIEYVI